MPKPHPIPPHPDVIIESEQQVWPGRFPLEVVKFRNRRFDGAMSATRTWELWRRGQAVALLPYDPATDTVVLIDQFRLPALAAALDPVLVELPAGLCEPNENPPPPSGANYRKKAACKPTAWKRSARSC